jgi:hypothetical protein
MSQSSLVSRFDEYSLGERLLREINWRPNPTVMLKLPSIAKGTTLRALCEAEAVKTGQAVAEIIECVRFAARIEHLISIGGEETRSRLLEQACLTPEQIARLCRRMPPFIEEKLDQLKAGQVDIDSNPNGAFDTNGWSELRTRLPKFRSTLQHYAASCTKSDLGAAQDHVEPVHQLLVAICSECDALNAVLQSQKPVGEGKPRIAKLLATLDVNWSKAKTKFAQVLGVLRKTNRDLKSEHWKDEWIPTVADHRIIMGDVEVMKNAALHMLTPPSVNVMNAP